MLYVIGKKNIICYIFLLHFSSVREDCVRIFNFQIAALNGSSNNSPTSSNLLEDMYRITSQI